LVNYFGHAAVASWHSANPATVLGAMLPDFATMSGTRLAEATDAGIAAGIALHHVTDGAFHHLPPVLALMRELDARLVAGGCARGPRRAVAHIGVELLLDGVLVTEPTYRNAYSAALEYDTSGVTFRHAEDPPRFAALHARLRSYGVPDDLRNPEAIVHRLHRMTAHRPLLAPSASDLSAIRTALIEHKPRVDVATDTVVRALRAALTSLPDPSPR
jgi:acyl carrier protein phosphodiesterase